MVLCLSVFRSSVTILLMFNFFNNNDPYQALPYFIINAALFPSCLRSNSFG